MDIHEPSCDTGPSPAKTDAPLFQWEYPDAVKALEKIHPSDLSKMIIAEVVRRLPVVAKHLAGNKTRIAEKEGKHVTC